MTKKVKLDLKGLKVKSFITGANPKMLKGGTHASCNTCNPCNETHIEGTCGCSVNCPTETCRCTAGPRCEGTIVTCPV